MAYVTYTAKREIEPTGFSKTGTDFSAIGSDDSFDAATTNISGLLTDQWLQAAGFVKNPGWFQVKSNSTSAKILTNTPPVTHLRLPGVAGNYASTPDTAAVSITGDIDLRGRVQCDDWTLAARNQTVIAKRNGAAQNSYVLRMSSTGLLTLVWSANGTAELTADSTLAVAVTDGQIKWVRGTLTVNNGAAGRDIKFYTSDDGAVWTQLGATVTQAGVTSIFDSTAIVEIGSSVTGGGEWLGGRVYYAEIRNGIGGTVVAAFDPSRGTRGAGSLVALTGETWTINTSGTPPALLQGPLLTYEGAEYLNMPSSGNATTPDTATVSITGDIDLRVQALLVDWTPASDTALLSKDDIATNRDYVLGIQASSTGKLYFIYTTDGSTTAGRVAVSTVAAPFSDGSIGWARATYATGTGVVQFFTSSDGLIWTQLGTNVTLTSGAIHNGTSVLSAGASASGVNNANGRIYYAEVRNGIGGPVVAAFDPGRAAAGAGSLVAYTGETWTINAGASLVRTTPVTITGYKRGFGQSYNLEFKAEQVDRKVKFNRNEQRPIGGGAAEVLFRFSDPTVDVLTEILSESSQVPQFREFLASVAGGEVFTIDRYGTVAAPVDPRQAQLESVGYDEKRVMTTMQQRIPFTVRLLT